VVGRKKILTEPPIAGIILESLEYLRGEGRVKLFSYVIMPDHLHLILLPLQKDEKEQTISDIMRDFKKFTSKKIMDYLKKTMRTVLLGFFSRSARGYEGQQYKVWQDGFFDENVFTQDFLNQKIQYIHYNPVRKGMVTEPEDYPFSSAKNFVSEGEGDLELDELGDYGLRDAIPKTSVSEDGTF
jgi:putative transposase